MKFALILVISSLSLVASQDLSEEEYERIRTKLLTTANDRANDIKHPFQDQNTDSFTYLYVEDSTGRIGKFFLSFQSRSDSRVSVVRPFVRPSH